MFVLLRFDQVASLPGAAGIVSRFASPRKHRPASPKEDVEDEMNMTLNLNILGEMASTLERHYNRLRNSACALVNGGSGSFFGNSTVSTQSVPRYARSMIDP